MSELSLAKNLVSDEGVSKISEFLTFNGSSLKVLNLHWNKIMYKGGLSLTEALNKNDTLKILDLSWNLIGKHSVTVNNLKNRS